MLSVDLTVFLPYDCKCFSLTNFRSVITDDHFRCISTAGSWGFVGLCPHWRIFVGPLWGLTKSLGGHLDQFWKAPGSGLRFTWCWLAEPSLRWYVEPSRWDRVNQVREKAPVKLLHPLFPRNSCSRNVPLGFCSFQLRRFYEVFCLQSR